MEPDCYRVEVVHFYNPHLIWVEVLNTGKANAFEQIGIYGVLPRETYIDNEDNSVKTKQCTEWAPAARITMTDLLDEAAEVWFSPVHIDRRSSVFDDNVHKYGDLIIKTQNGATKKMSTALQGTLFAYRDECQFYQTLFLGQLNTQLNNTQIQIVIRSLKKYYKRMDQIRKMQKEQLLNKQTAISNTAHMIENVLTTRNLEKHNAELILANKIKDLKICKATASIDEEPMGRATKVSHKHSKQISLLLRKKLDIEIRKKNQPLTNQSYAKMLSATKKFLDTNAVKHEDSDGVDVKEEPEIWNIEEKVPVATSNQASDENYRPNAIMQSSLSTDFHEDVSDAHETKPRKKVKKSGRKIPPFDVKTEKLVAYGPPVLDKQSLVIKIEPINANMALDTSSEIDKSQENVELRMAIDNPFAAEDSGVNIAITNKESLKHLTETKTEENNESGKTNSKIGTTESPEGSGLKSKRLQHVLKLWQQRKSKEHDSSLSNGTDTTSKDTSFSPEDKRPSKKYLKTDSDNESDEGSIGVIMDRFNAEHPAVKVNIPKTKDLKGDKSNITIAKRHVNPFKNVDESLSVFVDKLVAPILMVHTKMNNRIQPCANMRDIHFNSHVKLILRNMSIEQPMMLQMVSWNTILRGYSFFMVSGKDSGKTLGYLPAVCRLIADDDCQIVGSNGPRVIIVCATTKSVAHIERLSKIFLGTSKKVITCYPGINEEALVLSLLNGCDLLVCTPTILVRFLQLTDFGVDLKRLTTVVLDDCERLSEVYVDEVKVFLFKINEMLKNRVDEAQVQYIVASRIWADLMEPLAKRAPNSVVCIGAFHECVLYSKANTTVNFVEKDRKLDELISYLSEVISNSKIVIVCRHDEEVTAVEKALRYLKYVVFASNSQMTVQDLYKLNLDWGDYDAPLISPILVCCDGNLNHLNVTNANYLIHYSMPPLFSMFCKRFSVLNDNYPSIFKKGTENVKIKIFVEDGNLEQLPKILNFIKRCTSDIPEHLDKVSSRILAEKDVAKAKLLVPICDNVLTLGNCPNFWNCVERHNVLQQFDEPKQWMPRNGVVKFKILHYHNAVCYSALLLSVDLGSTTTKYDQTYSTLSLKMGMYYGKESNRKLHGIPKVGDICAMSVKQNFFIRCLVIKILNYYAKGAPNNVLVRMIDEEKLETTRDIYLFYLPDELRHIETYVVQVRLANLQPKEKDITFSDLARDGLKKITDRDEDIYLRGNITLSVGNCIFVDTLEACQKLSSFNEVVVIKDFKQELLKTHANANLDHVYKLKKLCLNGGLNVKETPKEVTPSVVKAKTKERWAFMERDKVSAVLLASVINPGKFFIRLPKFEIIIQNLLKDIQTYVKKSTAITEFSKGDIVIALFPDDSTYERARIDEILNNDKVKCFFVDQGEWREVATNNLYQMKDKFITHIPFQAIECRLIGVKPAGVEWTEFSANWFYDNCLEESTGFFKNLYAKYFIKEKAEFTGGHKYGIILLDTNSNEDVILNQLIVDVNLAQEEETEMIYFKNLKFDLKVGKSDDSDDNGEWEKIAKVTKATAEINKEVAKPAPLSLFAKPIRSVPLVDSEDDGDMDKWAINDIGQFMSLVKPVAAQYTKAEELPAIGNKDDSSENDESYNEYSIIEKSGGVRDVKEINASNTENDSSMDISEQHITTLDSDDLSSTEVMSFPSSTKSSLVNVSPVPESVVLSEKPATSESSEVSRIQEKCNLAVSPKKSAERECVGVLRKPTLKWLQTKTTTTIKILLIGVEDYTLEIQDKYLKFRSTVNDMEYGFEFELYGVVESKTATHNNKGQYILVKLSKVLKGNWLTLTRDNAIKKWIQYDVDNIDTSSDEKNVYDDSMEKILKNIHYKDETDTDDDDFVDDVHRSGV